MLERCLRIKWRGCWCGFWPYQGGSFWAFRGWTFDAHIQHSLCKKGGEVLGVDDHVFAIFGRFFHERGRAAKFQSFHATRYEWVSRVTDCSVSTGHANAAWESGFDMAREDDTVYCNVQMSLASGKELRQLVTALRESGSHPNLDAVFARMQFELTMTIDIVEHPPTWGAGEPTKH